MRQLKRRVGPPINLKAELMANPAPPLEKQSRQMRAAVTRRSPQRIAAANKLNRELLVPVLEANEGEEKVIVEKEIQRTSLHAVREMKEQLLYSDDSKERREAAQYFLNAAGHGKKDGIIGGAGSIIVIAGIQPGQMPWVEGKVIKKDAESAPAQIEAGPVSSGTGQG